ncbi:MAG: CocE/NonD family hydrolase [Clostridia bacterium]|nr:CocE/NonD family hydrolase [Clostridia bacterium]
MRYFTYTKYIEFSDANFFTVVLLPQKEGTFPTVIFRTPYVQSTVEMPDDEVKEHCLTAHAQWLSRGYAVVYQHCRGQGKSTGAFVPYIHEREDGLALREWVRKQPFYNGELYLCGGSYTASLHYATAPFEEDVKGAVFEVQDSERYRLWYRNGQMRKGHANWHFSLYKNKCNLNKKFTMASFSERPLQNLSERVLGDRAEDFEQMLMAPHPLDAFWNTRFGGQDARQAVTEATIPILLTSGYNDFYVGGVFDMWNSMRASTKQESALLVSPYNHGDGSCEESLCFAKGTRSEQFGPAYAIDWFDHIRKGTSLPFPKGVITYYRTFEDKWAYDFYGKETQTLCVVLGEGASSFRYDPLHPPSFSEEGSFSVEKASKSDYISVVTKPLDRDVFVKGKMRARLTVASDCTDSSFYLRISIKKAAYTYVLRHDITSLGYQLGSYTPKDVVELNFCFDEYAFLLKKGEQLQIDIASTNDNAYVSHTNQQGAYSLRTDTKIATNTVWLDRSILEIPVEKKPLL